MAMNINETENMDNKSNKSLYIPPIWTPLYIHRKKLYDVLNYAVSETLIQCSKSVNKEKVRVLDVGCGSKPYQSLFTNNNVCDVYHGADIDKKTNPKIDIEILIDNNLQRIDAEDSTYDCVVHFQVLEHVKNTEKFINECYRVLSKGGIMLCTVPFIFEYHAVPQDFYRWTNEGLYEEIIKGGFEDIHIQAVENDLESLITVTELFLARKFGYVYTKPLFYILNLLSKLPLSTSTNLLPLTYIASAIKPKK